MKINVAVVQYDVPCDDNNSFVKVAQIAKEAQNNSAKLLVLPETSVGLLDHVKHNGTDYLPRLCKIAWENNIQIATSFYARFDKSIIDQGVVISSQGKVILNFQKIYLAKTEIEDNIVPGNKLQTVQTDIGRTGMLICKDGFNRFSHYLFEKFSNERTNIICIPTWSLGTWNVNTEDYIKTFYTYGSYLSRAFVLVAGNLNIETKSFGRSLIISPLTGVVSEGSRDEEELLIETIDLEDVKKAREFDVGWQPQKRII